MKTNWKIKRIKIQKYGGTVFIVSFKNNWEKVLNYLKKKNVDISDIQDPDNVGIVTIGSRRNGSKFFIFVLESNCKRCELVHEVFHLTQYIMEYYGVDFKKGDNNEAYAYMIESLYKQIEPIYF